MLPFVLYRIALHHYLRFVMTQRTMSTQNSQWDRLVATRSGLTLRVRAGGPRDAEALGDFYRRLAPDDLRFRFLSAFSEVPKARIDDMLSGDHHAKEMLLAFDMSGEIIVGYALVAGDGPEAEPPRVAEIAVSVDPAFRRQGVGRAMVGEAERFARREGFQSVELIGSRENRGIAALERSLGYDVRSMPDDAQLTVARRKLTA